ncbi:MAG: Ribonuclease VapC49 [Anaerolineales bacterium]|nr:Ribonuclease VapC49 [Anaerolineales bacterium]
MAVYYFDTSALVKRYAQETGTGWVTNLANPISGNDIYIVRITGPEMIAAVFRKVRTGEISSQDASQAATDFKNDFRTQYQIVEITSVLADRAMMLAEQHGLRGYDSVQLAGAYELQTMRDAMGLPPLVFISSDHNLNTAAQNEGLSADNPNHHP